MTKFYRDIPAVTDVEPRVKDGLARQHEGLQEMALEVARTVGADGRAFTSADLRRAGVLEPDHPSHWGSLVAQLQRRGFITYAGLRLEYMPSGGLKPVRAWKLTAQVQEQEISVPAEMEPDAAA